MNEEELEELERDGDNDGTVSSKTLREILRTWTEDPVHVLWSEEPVVEVRARPDNDELFIVFCGGSRNWRMTTKVRTSVRASR